MKCVYQTEASECGLACLAMISQSYGAHYNLQELRRRFSISLKGVKLTQLIEMADRLGLDSRALRVEVEDLRRIKIPCILHWGLDHFVVLTGTSNGRFSILDPAAGALKLPASDVSSKFTGVALELVPTAKFTLKKPPPTIQFSQLIGPIDGFWKSMLQLLLLSGSLQVLVIVGPFFMQWVIDQALPAADQGLLTILCIAFLMLLLMQSSISMARGWCVIHLSSQIRSQWLSNIFAHTLRLPLSFFEKRHLGDITSRMGSVQTIQQTVTTSFLEALVDGAMAIATFALMSIYSWKLVLITMTTVATYALIRSFTYQKIRHRTERKLIAEAKQESYLLESIRGVQSLKSANKECLRRSNFSNYLNASINEDVRLGRINIGFITLNQTLFGVERILVIWAGALLTLNNIFSVGMLVAYLAYKEQFTLRVSGLIDKVFELRMLRLHGERMADIVLAEPEVDVEWDVVDIDQPSIEVEGLSFRYADGEPWVLRNCSFKIDAGESVAITGPSGCGKTTLVKLLLGLLTPIEGTIRIGGRDAQSIGARSLRSVSGTVMQDDQLFAGTVADNISFFSMEEDFSKIVAAAKIASIHDEIQAMPMGYHSYIGDMGSSLSGGQRQRIILARALFNNPKFIFLDEATSHLDMKCEQLVNDAVRELRLTKVIVAHRRETIESADRVLQLASGAIL